MREHLGIPNYHPQRETSEGTLVNCRVKTMVIRFGRSRKSAGLLPKGVKPAYGRVSETERLSVNERVGNPSWLKVQSNPTRESASL